MRPGERDRSRQLLVVVIVAALAAAWAVGRLTAPRADTPPVATRGTLPASPWAIRTVAGVPVGYPRTRAGAVAAMAAFGQALADPRVQLDDRRRSDVARAVGT